MNWAAAGALGEILGALAVFGSLVYLAIQIKAQNRESRSLAIHEISEAFRESVALFTQADLAAAFAKLENGVGVSDTERVQLNAASQKLLRVWEEAFHQHTSDRLDSKVWLVIEQQYQAFLASRALTDTWTLRKQYFDPGFRKYVESLNVGEYVYRPD